MKSPFPGMDPYLETRWGDVHSRLNIYASDVLSRCLPPGLLARSEERTIVRDPLGKVREIIPDVSVLERETRSGSAVATVAELAESTCVLIPESVEIIQRFLEIRDSRSGGDVVTVIEFVSPTNKRPGDGLDKYLRKQNECIDGDVNLVEIDLTRAGDRGLIMPLKYVHSSILSTYAATVRRAGEKDRFWFYRLPLEKRLGAIPIPLRKTDKDVVLDLQSLINQIYDNGRYAEDLKYTETLKPALEGPQSEWAASRISAR